MNKIELRSYQHEAIDDLTTAAGNGAKRLLLQAPCGAGKTIIAAQIMNSATSSGHRVLFLAHRRELVLQCAAKLEQLGIYCGIIMAGDEWDTSHLVDVASIQTYGSWLKRQKIGIRPVDLIIIDEAHHLSSSKSWQAIIEKYPQALMLGMTATPINMTGKGMAGWFDEMIKCPSIANLIEQNHLVPAKYYVPSIPDLRKVRVVAGDYVKDELEKVMDVPQLIGDICENWSRICPTRKTLVFASGVRHSLAIVDAFRAIGIKAAHVDGTTPKEERDEILRNFTDGETQVLSNCAVFTEGTDIPAASCLVFARPTKSLLLYLQVAGRVLRPYKNKQDAIILDHAGVVYEHGPIEQDWDWRLQYGKKGSARPASARLTLKRPITCLKCKCVYYRRLDCPECHWKPTMQGKVIETYDAYLQALDDLEYGKQKTPILPVNWYRQFVHWANSKGYAHGWAYHKFIEKFKYKPDKSWQYLDPMEPELEVRSWIRHIQIKYAMSKRREGRDPNQPVAWKQKYDNYPKIPG